MINLVVASGKGGTGKTTVAVNLALALSEQKIQLLDCDVEEPNAHLFLKNLKYEILKVGIPVPSICMEKCSCCGYCAEVCSFNALAVIAGQVLVYAELCHGCGSCSYLCPEKAITEIDRTIGSIEKASNDSLNFAYGCLNPGEAMSPPLINAVKEMVNAEYITIIDAPPGTSCPAITAVKDCDYCLLVTEPTPFGLNDLNLAYLMVCELGIPAGVVINRSDYGDNEVTNFCRDKNIPILMEMPFDYQVAQLYARGEPIVLHSSKWLNSFRNLYRNIIKNWKRVQVK